MIRMSEILTIFLNCFKRNCQKFLHFRQILVTPSVEFLSFVRFLHSDQNVRKAPDQAIYFERNTFFDVPITTKCK